MKKYIIIFSVLILNNFFGILDTRNTLLLALIVPFVVLGINRKSIYSNYFLVLLFGLIVNIISCRYFNGQDYISTFKAIPVFLYIYFYYVLKFFNPSLKVIESALPYLILIFDILYIVQFILIPYGIYIIPIDTDYIDKQNAVNTRFRMVSSGLFSLGIFYGINKYIKEKNLISLLCIIGGIIVLLLLSFRIMIPALILSAVYLVFRIKGFKFKNLSYIFGLFIILIILFNLPIFNDKLNFMLEKGVDQNLNNQDYIRVIQFDYFERSHFKSIWERVFGSGLYIPDTQYGKNMDYLANELHLTFVDWGLYGLSWMIGIVPVLVMIAYSVKIIFLKVNKDYLYIGAWYIFLLSVSLVNIEFYRNGNFLIQAIALYIAEKANNHYNVHKRALKR